MALFLLESKTVVRELIVATGLDRDTIHELLLARRYVQSCVTLCHVQLLEPWFRQREKEESMQGESILMFTCVEEDKLQQLTRDSHAGDFLLREDVQRDSSHNLGP